MEKTQKNHIMLGTLSRLDQVPQSGRHLAGFQDAGRQTFACAPANRRHRRRNRQSRSIGSATGHCRKSQLFGRRARFKQLFPKHRHPAQHTQCGQATTAQGVGDNILKPVSTSTPVVSYDAAGISEMVINGQTGYCTPLRDLPAFSAAVETLGQRCRFAPPLRRCPQPPRYPFVLRRRNLPHHHGRLVICNGYADEHHHCCPLLLAAQ